LAKGFTVILSPLTVTNAFVYHVCWAGTFASGGRRTMHNALMHMYVTMGHHCLLKNAPSCTENGFSSKAIFLEPTNSISISSAVFTQLIHLPNTHRQTHRPSYVHKICGMCAGDAA